MMLGHIFAILSVFITLIEGNGLFVRNKAAPLRGIFSKQDVTFPVSGGGVVSLAFYGKAPQDISITFNYTGDNILTPVPPFTLKAGHNESMNIQLHSKDIGHTVLYANASPSHVVDMTQAFARVSVSHTASLDYLSDTVGWLYFTAWSISFYPQIILNYRRKSVIGLHFDFLALNVIGFLYYSLFNVALYWVPAIQVQYFTHHPFGVNPVQLNDVIFSLHAFVACVIQVVQCFIYERGDQKVSRTARSILCVIALATFLMTMLAVFSVFQWLQFLYFISYIKLFITLIKYIPQAYYNYRRKSTSGWSIGNVLLDFTGGSLSIAQMFIIAFNYNDWGSIFGDPTKFGLGLFSILFDILFMVQHYVLYRNSAVMTLLRSPDASLRDNSPLVPEGSQSSYGTVGP